MCQCLQVVWWSYLRLHAIDGGRFGWLGIERVLTVNVVLAGTYNADLMLESDFKLLKCNIMYVIQPV